MRKVLKVVSRAIAPLLLIVWASLAIWIDGPASRPLAALLSGAFTAGSCIVLLFVHPFRRAAVIFAAAFLGVTVWWTSIEPRNDRDWLPDVEQLPTAEVRGDLVTIRNMRNFDYRSETDFTPRWETRMFDLRDLRSVDFFLSYWSSRQIAHTIVSWDFGNGQHLAVSIETRKERHESYSALLGFFRQYELYYVVSDERDIIRLRTNHRNEEVYLYRLTASVERARAILLDYLEEVNRLAERPRWYNALTHNCTTTIHRHVQHVVRGNPWNWRILVNGYIDELGYMRGTIDTSLPFAELRRRSNITERARRAGAAPDFSERIRHGLPRPPIRD